MPLIIKEMTNDPRANIAPIGGVRGKVESTSMSFEDELFAQEGEPIDRAKLEKMLEKIDKQGAKLSKTPTFDELADYRSLIKNFVSTVVAGMYEVHSSGGWDRFGRQRAYTTVRKIDQELENMAERIRLGQADQLDIIASHDAIRGMLVDLYM